MKRIFDITVSVLGLSFFSPLLAMILLLIWLQDFANPFYVSYRIGKEGRKFKIYKLRSMVINADKTGVDSTSSDDNRITNVGLFIRKFKLDEISQLINVLIGNMSLVGPRPNVEREVQMYTELEKRLLSFKPGITDYASIVFSDEGDILKGYNDPDIAYHQLVRPGKGALGLFYIENNSLLDDLKLIYFTVLSIFSRDLALKNVSNMLKSKGADRYLIELALRQSPLEPMPPIGSDIIVTSRGA